MWKSIVMKQHNLFMKHFILFWNEQHSLVSSWGNKFTSNIPFLSHNTVHMCSGLKLFVWTSPSWVTLNPIIQLLFRFQCNMSHSCFCCLHQFSFKCHHQNFCIVQGKSMYWLNDWLCIPQFILLVTSMSTISVFCHNSIKNFLKPEVTYQIKMKL